MAAHHVETVPGGRADRCLPNRLRPLKFSGFRTSCCDLSAEPPGASRRSALLVAVVALVGLGLFAAVLTAAVTVSSGGAQAETSETDIGQAHIDMLHAARAQWDDTDGSGGARVVNGREAEPYEFPSVMAVVWAHLSDFEGMRCGSTAISTEWVLTAGHCVRGGDIFDATQQLEVLVGAWYLPLELGARHRICEVHVHPDYTEQLANDIALLRLCERHHQPTSALPADTAFELPGSTADVVGWGLTEEDPSYTGELRVARLGVQRSAECSRFVGSSLPNPVIDDFHLCAGGSIDACGGDSGGPLLTGAYVVGITSFGDDPCAGAAPGVFTRVSTYVPWITELTGVVPGFTTGGVSCGEAFATHVGTEAGEEIITGDRGDVIVALEGADIVSSGDGIDLVCAGPGDDIVALGAGFADAGLGGEGNDVLYGQAGDDVLDGGDGDDRLRGGAGNDELDGGDGADDVAGGSGDDLVIGGPGDDVALRGGTGDDLLDGGDGNDVLVAGNGGQDIVFGGAGDEALITGGPRPDAISGGPGNDVIKGNKGADTLHGDDGDDELRGGPQPDDLDGGDGADQCIGGTTGDDAIEADTADNCEGDLLSIP